jgi:hypothetical protein
MFDYTGIIGVEPASSATQVHLSTVNRSRRHQEYRIWKGSESGSNRMDLFSILSITDLIPLRDCLTFE